MKYLKKITISLTLILVVIFVSLFINFMNKKDEVSFNDSSQDEICEMALSEVLTFDEISKKIAERNNISISEAEKEIQGNFSIDSNVSPKNSTYRIIYQTFHVTNVYSPCLELYCETKEEPIEFQSIEKIINVSLNLNSNNKVKQFNGNIYVNIENPKTIFWILNGDFYDDGIASTNKETIKSTAKSKSVNFTVPSDLKHYKYLYKKGHAHF